MTMITPSYLGETIEYSSLHACRSTLEDPTYTTGDVAVMEDDGFLTITDRLSRFSKIAGEMVPHRRIEEKLQEIVNRTEQVFAVTSVENDKKGERIMVVTTLSAAELETVLQKFTQCDLPALWKPKPGQFVRTGALPLLGTGKLDLRAVRALAMPQASELVG